MTLPGLNELVGLARHIELRAVSRWVGLGSIVGVLAGLAASLLFIIVEWLRHFVVSELAHSTPLEAAGEPALFSASHYSDERLWVLMLAPAVGAFLSAWLIYRFAPEAVGGNEGWLKSFHRGRGRISLRVVPVKLIASALHLGAGASAGREGPVAHIGAALGATVGRLFKLSDRERRLLLIAGAAGGIGAIFRTPLGGALFVVEVLYIDDFEVDALVPSVLSSVVAYSLFTAIFGEGFLFAVPSSFSFDARELPIYFLMALMAGLVGVVFVSLHERVGVWSERWRVPIYMRALVGGLIVGALALVHPAALGAGYGWMQEALVPTGTGLIPSGWGAVGVLLTIAAVKVIATSVSASTGAAGGVFGPSVVIGGMVGGAFGIAFHLLFPQIVTDPSSYMLVGMACFVGGVTSSPISTLVMASEMTGSYSLLVPTMLAQVTTYALIRRYRLYEEQVPTRRESPAHGGEYVLDILQDLKVKDVARVQPLIQVERHLPLAALLRQATEAQQSIFPVIGVDGRPEGVVTLETVKAFVYDEDIGMLAIAADCQSPYISLQEEDSLALALEVMAKSHYQELPVEGPDSEIIGLIAYDDLLEAYSSELSSRKDGRDLELALQTATAKRKES